MAQKKISVCFFWHLKPGKENYIRNEQGHNPKYVLLFQSLLN